VHFPSDVLAGWLVGGVVLILFLWLEKPVGAWIVRQPLWLQLLIPLLVALVIIAKGLWVSAVTADRIVLQDWITRSTAAFPDEPPINPQDLDVVSSAATLFGLGAGAVLLHRWGKFSATGSLTARAARFALGLVGVIVIYFGLRMILPVGDDLLAQSLRFVRYALVGLWVAFLAPRVFVKLKLA